MLTPRMYCQIVLAKPEENEMKEERKFDVCACFLLDKKMSCKSDVTACLDCVVFLSLSILLF